MLKYFYKTKTILLLCTTVILRSYGVGYLLIVKMTCKFD